jgi:hypothetical protein
MSIADRDTINIGAGWAKTPPVAFSIDATREAAYPRASARGMLASRNQRVTPTTRDQP